MLAGAGAIISGRIVSRNQARDLASANAEAAKANKGVADTGLEIAKAKEETARLTEEAERAKADRAEADHQIEIAKVAASFANVRAAKLEMEAADAMREQQKVQTELTKQQTLLATQQERAAKAELELERVKSAIGPFQINREVFLKALEGQPKAPVQILYLKDDQRAFEFAQEIEYLLKKAGWEVTERRPIPANASEIPTAMVVGGQPTGVTGVAHSVTENELEGTDAMLLGKQDWVRTPWNVLRNAFLHSMGEGRSTGNIKSVPEGILRVVVAAKPVK